MKLTRLGLISFLIIAMTADFGRPEGEEVDSYYNRLFARSFDILEILSNRRILDKMSDCLLGISRCSSVGKMLKELLPDMLKTDCSKCTIAQKNEFYNGLLYLQVKKPDMYQKLMQRYDTHLTSNETS